MMVSGRLRCGVCDLLIKDGDFFLAVYDIDSEQYRHYACHGHVEYLKKGGA